jgi:uncharacterized membrane protein
MAEEQKPVLDIDEKNIFAALCYVGVLILVPWLVRKEDPFVNWHIRQGLLVLAVLILSLIASAWIAVVGNLVFLLVMLVDVIALVQALMGKSWKIPLLGNLASRFRI